MDGTPDDMREALLQSPGSLISYESFPRPAAPKFKSAPSFTASSFTDARSQISSDTSQTTITSHGSASKPKTKPWVASITVQARFWLSSLCRRRRDPSKWYKGGGVIRRLRHMSSAPKPLLHAILTVLIGLGAAVVAYIADMGESHLFDWKFGFCAGDWTATKTTCCSGCKKTLLMNILKTYFTDRKS